jgi:N-acetylglucosamine-6-phosphate deacetylase
MRFELIPDGVHVHPAMIFLVWKLSGPGRLVAVSGAMSALGMPPGKHGLGPGQEVFVGRIEPGYRADLVLLSPDL